MTFNYNTHKNSITFIGFNQEFSIFNDIFDLITEYAGMHRYRPTDTGYK